MGQGYHVDPEQIRQHAANVETVAARFGAVKSASGHIAGDAQAYGALCGWISGILEDRHRRQDELIAYVEENLDLVAKALRETAEYYELVEQGNSDLIRTSGGEVAR
ncbi:MULTISPECIES: type VII secretion target [unclassified Saccharothrix]|uniref:type VII secretion target n=1 Tax=unclassified Saccharothrix TaxID=2593673 RepID=UPI00307EB170